MQLRAALAALLAIGGANAQLQQVNDFNAGPTRLRMYAVVPRNLKTPAPIIVAVHHCQGSATGYAGSTRYDDLASQYGFIAIYPNSKSGGGCFDVASTASTYHVARVPAKGGGRVAPRPPWPHCARDKKEKKQD